MTLATQHGLTLPEILLVLSLASVLYATAIPAVGHWVTQNRQQQIAQRLMQTLQMARAQAVILGVSTEVCPTLNGLDCGSDWSQGWLIREARTQAALSTELNDHPDDVSVQWFGVNPTIVFKPDGQSPLGNGRFVSCDADTPNWQIVLSRQGRARWADAEEHIQHAHRCH